MGKIASPGAKQDRLVPISFSRGLTSGLFAELGPLSESLLKPSPQHVCLTLWIFSEVLFKLTFYLVPGTFHFELVHGEIRHLESDDCSI